MKSQLEEVRQDNLVKDAKIKDLQNRLFGKKSEKDSPLKSEQDGPDGSRAKRNHGQQPGHPGHGRTKRPDLPVVDDEIDLADAAKRCPSCGLPHLPKQAIAPLFKPVHDALYCKQMSEELFHNDETRWEVFVEVEGKVGTRWYLWVTRSPSVIFYCIDPSRSAAVPGAHFAGLQAEKVIVVCDRYSAYKKLARLAENILLAFGWAHVRRDFLDAGRAFTELEAWALEWKAQIATLYHFNGLRLEQWDPRLTLDEQSADFREHHTALQAALKCMHEEATRTVAENDGSQPDATLSKSARTRQTKVLRSLLEHWSGLIVFVENPAVPMDNNRAENTIRMPVNGRKNDYGSGSIWSAELAAMLFAILQTMVLWGINPRHWLTDYLTACAENGGRAPRMIDPFLPWSMDETRRNELSRPAPSGGAPTAVPPILDSS